MRVLIVDDTIVYRSMLKMILAEVEGIEVVGVAGNGSIALQKVEQRHVDLMILDIEMPVMDGLETVRELKKNGHKSIKIIMFSGVSRSSTNLTLDALAAGADDVVAKPGLNSVSRDEAIEYIKTELISKVIQFRDVLGTESPIREEKTPRVAETTQLPPPTSGRWKSINLNNFLPRIIVLASSTGGPHTLEDLFTDLGGPSCPPILLCQHMPPVFTAMLADRLNKLSKISFKEGAEGDYLERGHAYIAPGDFHMEVSVGSDARLQLKLNQEPKQNSVRPAADPLFISAVKVASNHCMGIVLTGMGQDGMRGAMAIKDAGGGVFVQSKETCVVWGMPAAVYEAGAFDQIGDIEACRTIIKQTY